MLYRQRTKEATNERHRIRASWFGTASLGIMCGLILANGAVPLFNHPVVLLFASPLTCPLFAWLAIRCLMTTGAGNQFHAWIALALVAFIVVVQVIELSPYFPPSTWG